MAWIESVTGASSSIELTYENLLKATTSAYVTYTKTITLDKDYRFIVIVMGAGRVSQGSQPSGSYSVSSGTRVDLYSSYGYLAGDNYWGSSSAIYKDVPAGATIAISMYANACCIYGLY